MADPEEAFCMDQFTEATLIAKPMIYISLQELYDTHVLLLQHLDSIAPEKRDPLRELLEDLGDSPSICSLLGAANGTQNGNPEDASLSHLAKTEVNFTIANIVINPLHKHSTESRKNMNLPYSITPLENGNSSSLKCLGRKLYSLKRVCTGVFKNGKIKIFHTCPKE